MDQCYNRISIMYEENIRFFYPITRQTFQSADLYECSDEHLNLFQLDEKSCIELSLQITKVTKPYLFKPKKVVQQIKKSFASTHDDSIYHYAQILFSRKIISFFEKKEIIQKVSRSFLNARKFFSGTHIAH